MVYKSCASKKANYPCPGDEPGLEKSNGRLLAAE
jgi:hypothetical protein